MKMLLRVSALVLILATGSMADKPTDLVERTGTVHLSKTDSPFYYLVYAPLPFLSMTNYHIMTNDEADLKQLADFEKGKVRVKIEGLVFSNGRGTELIIPYKMTEVK